MYRLLNLIIVFTCAEMNIKFYNLNILQINERINELLNSTVVLFSRDPPKVAHAPKTAAHKKHPLCEEKHVHGIVLVLPKPKIAFKTAKQLPNTKY